MTNGTQTVTLVTNGYDQWGPVQPNGTPRQWESTAGQMGYATTVGRPGSERMLTVAVADGSSDQ